MLSAEQPGDPSSQPLRLDLLQQGGTGMEMAQQYEEPEFADQVRVVVVLVGASVVVVLVFEEEEE